MPGCTRGRRRASGSEVAVDAAWPVRAVRALGTAGWLVVRAGTGLAREAFEADALTRDRFAASFLRYAWAPLPVLLGLALLAGLVAGTIGTRLLALDNAQYLIVPLLLRTLCGDVVPLLCGLFAAGRVSVDLAARLATTGLMREIDALEALGRDPVRHLLSPALAGVVIAVPIQTAGAAIVAVVATGAALRLDGAIDWPAFLHLASAEPVARAAMLGMAKTLLFALIAFGVGAAVGSREARGASGIGRSATTAFTIGLLGIFAADALWTIL